MLCVHYCTITDMALRFPEVHQSSPYRKLKDTVVLQLFIGAQVAEQVETCSPTHALPFCCAAGSHCECMLAGAGVGGPLPNLTQK